MRLRRTALFTLFGNFRLDLLSAAGAIALISLIATAVEALPFRDIDNITLTVVALILGLWLL